MMKIAVAGTNGFAQHIANCLKIYTPYQLVVLSRGPNPGLTRRGWQIAVTDYRDPGQLEYLLEGVDVVISTIGGEAQMALINAAARARVGRFVPNEFGGLPNVLPHEGPVEIARRNALILLQSSGMRYTCFFFGAFYERFVAGRLADSQISTERPLGVQAFLVDVSRRRGTCPLRLYDPLMKTPGMEVYISMISAVDAARFVVDRLARIPQPQWPSQFNFCAETLTVPQIVQDFRDVTGQRFVDEAFNWTTDIYLEALRRARRANDATDTERYSQLLMAARGGFDLGNTSTYHRDFARQDFQTWLREIFNPSPPI